MPVATLHAYQHKLNKYWIAFAVPSVILCMTAFSLEPITVLLAVITLACTIPIFMWLDRLEPGYPRERWNAVVWGGGICVLIAGTINTIAYELYGDLIAAVVVAPVSEELLKVLGVYLIARKGLIRSPLDGVVFAGYISLGFAGIENVNYFWEASTADELMLTFVGRGLFSPLAHPYFTAWAGWLIGRGAQNRQSVKTSALAGLLIGIPLHALWNAGASSEGQFFLITSITHLVLFTCLVVLLLRARRREVRLVREHLPKFATFLNLVPAELALYGNIKRTRRFRKTLKKQAKRRFDYRYSAVMHYVIDQVRGLP